MRRLLASLLVGAAAVTAACGDDDPTPDAAAFCERLDRLAANDPFAAFGDAATSEEVAAAFAALVARAAELVDVAPDEARPAARAYADAVARLEELLRRAGYDGSRVDTRAYREQEVRYREAARLLERHLDAECRGGPPTGRR